jgi:hypothetical protein
MKLTKTQLRELIKEELSKLKKENYSSNSDEVEKIKTLAKSFRFKEAPKTQALARLGSDWVDNDFLTSFNDSNDSWLVISKDGTASSVNGKNGMSGHDDIDDFTEKRHWRRVFK